MVSTLPSATATAVTTVFALPLTSREIYMQNEKAASIMLKKSICVLKAVTLLHKDTSAVSKIM